jgi:hypothetical protein
VRIEANQDELRMLANWLLRAAVTGEAYPAFVSDEELTRIEIRRTE